MPRSSCAQVGLHCRRHGGPGRAVRRGRRLAYPGRNPLSGEFEGRAATFASSAKEFELSDGTYAVELHHALADDDHTGALLRCTAQRDGKTLDMNYVLVSTQRRHDHRGLKTCSDQGAPDEFWTKTRCGLIRHDQARSAMSWVLLVR
jgi:uncharacterized protein